MVDRRLALAAGTALACLLLTTPSPAQNNRRGGNADSVDNAAGGNQGNAQNNRPNPREDPKAAQQMLRRMIGAPGTGFGGRGGPGGPGGFGGFGGNNAGLKGMLLQLPALQEEIGLTEEQLESLTKVDEAAKQQREIVDKPFNDQMQALRNQQGGQGGGRGGQGGDRGGRGGGNFFQDPQFQQLMQQRNQARATVQQKEQQMINKILTAAQKKRIAEIELQIKGPLSVSEPPMAKKLNLTPSQQQKVAAIIQQLQTTQQQLRTTAFQGMFGNNGGPGGPGFGPGGPGFGPGGPGFGPGGPGFAGGPGGTGGRGGQAQGGNNTRGQTASRSATTKDEPAAKKDTGPQTDNDENARRGPTNEQRAQMAARFNEMREKTEDVEEKAEMAIAKALTDRQKKAYMAMLGEPFDLTSIVPQFNRGGRGGNNNGGRNRGGN